MTPPFLSNFTRRWISRPACTPAFAIAASITLFTILAFNPAHAQRSSGSFVAIDAHSTHILAQQNHSRRIPIHGYARLATAVVTLDWSTRTGTDMALVITVPGEVSGTALNPMGLRPGDRISLRDLVYSVVLGSDDAAAMTLAATVGRDMLMRRQRGGDPIAEFVREMNNLARQEAMTHTRFLSPVAMPPGRRGAGNTSVGDLALLGRYAMSRPAFRFYSMQRERNVTVQRGGASSGFRVTNANAFASTRNFDGVMVLRPQPGQPAMALLSASRQPEVTPMADGTTHLYPRRIVVVVAGIEAPDQFAARLTEGAWAAFDQWTAEGRPHDPARLLRRGR